MKLYVIQASTLDSDKGFFVAGCTGTKFKVPVSYFLIEHEKGYVLFDSGHNQATVEDSAKAMPRGLHKAYTPEICNDGFVLDALKKAGVKPEDIIYHISSHLHFDHTGGLGLFPNATYIVQRDELHYAYVPDRFMKSAYFRADFDKKDINWLFLQGWNNHKHDLFDDGKIIIYFTPGHTPGHQSLLVNLDNDGPILLAADACYTNENLDGLVLSGLSCDNSTYIQSLKTLKDLQKRGVKIIPGHDPDTWHSLKKFPEFYS